MKEESNCFGMSTKPAPLKESYVFHMFSPCLGLPFWLILILGMPVSVASLHQAGTSMTCTGFKVPVYLDLSSALSAMLWR